jgi:hypothetical protein
VVFELGAGHASVEVFPEDGLHARLQVSQLLLPLVIELDTAGGSPSSVVLHAVNMVL